MKDRYRYVANTAMFVGLGLGLAACKNDQPQPGPSVPFGPAIEAPTARGEWNPGEIGGVTVFKIGPSEDEMSDMDLALPAQPSLAFNIAPLARIVSLFAQQGGKLPAESHVLLTDSPLPNNSPEYIFGFTNPETNDIIISTGRIREVGFIYDFQATTNGVLVAEVCKLMFTETGSLSFDVPLTPTVENIQTTCEGFGFMSASIVAGKTFEEYSTDLNTNTASGIKRSDIIATLDAQTYKVFQEALSAPIITLKGPDESTA